MPTLAGHPDRRSGRFDGECEHGTQSGLVAGDGSRCAKENPAWVHAGL